MLVEWLLPFTAVLDAASELEVGVSSLFASVKSIELPAQLKTVNCGRSTGSPDMYELNPLYSLENPHTTGSISAKSVRHRLD